MRRHLAILVCCLAAFVARGETIPPEPAGYFNDYAGVVSAQRAHELNERLAQFERQSSDQIVVAIYPKMQSDSEVAEYTTRVFRSWKVGQKDKNNGAVLFVFIQDHKWFVVTGYGLEGALPDGLVKTMMDRDLVANFRAGDYGGGLSAAVNDVIAAAQGEYHGTGRTVRDNQNVARQHTQNGFVVFVIIIFIALNIIFRSRRRYGWIGGPGGWGGWGGGGGGGGGGFSGFSGGGGSSGGGGAGGSW